MSEQIAAAIAAVAPAPQESATLNPAAENAQPVEPQKPQDENLFSSKFAALSRREKQILDREKKLKVMEEELSGKSSKVNSWEDRIKKMKEQPGSIDEVLSEAGITFEQYLNHKLGIQEEPKQLSPDEMYKKLKDEMESNFKKMEDDKVKASEAQNAQILEDFRSDIESTIKTNSDKYELINYQGDFNLVYDVIQEYFDQNGEVLSIEEAADHVEKHLEDLVMGATKLKKVSSKFAPKEPAQPVLASALETKPQNEDKKSAPAPTLNNDLNASNSSFRNSSLDIEESKRRAAQLLRWS